MEKVSDKQLKVLKLLMKGHTVKEIAQIKEVSKQSIYKLKKNLAKRLYKDKIDVKYEV